MKLRSGLLSRFGLLILVATTLRCSDGGTNPPAAARIELVSGNEQDGTVGTTLPESLLVLVTDDAGDPVEGVTVQWTAQGAGSVSDASVQTGDDGRVGVQLTLGPTAGTETVTASVQGLEGSPVTFTATAVGGSTGPALVIITQPPSDVVDGEVFAAEAQPVVRVDGDGGAPVAGATVTAALASGGGTLQGSLTVVTGSDGVAQFADLGITGQGSHTIEFAAPGVSATSSAIAVAALPSAAATGEWGSVVSWNIVPLHLTLLPSGKLLAWGRQEIGGGMGEPRLWDPSSGTPAAAPTIMADTMLFCAGHALMADGNLMVSGGHKADDRGLDVTNIFDSGTEQWMPGLPKMAHGRWYPTVTTLPDGRMVTVAGQDSASNVVLTPEVWDGTQWIELTGADNVEIPYYPRNFIDPLDGRVFMAGERIQSRWLDANGTGQWIAGPVHIWRNNRDYGSAVMYESGKILYTGGGGYTAWDTPDAVSPVPTATAERIDLNQGSPQWADAGSMSSPRRHHTATVLPDGQVLVTGGVSGGGFNAVGTGVRAAEIWDPETNGWTALASNAVTRAYHSVSILLPDGTVLHGGSGDANDPATGDAYDAERSHEIFRPPYLFRGARPAITNAPAVIGTGTTFDVTTPAAGQITHLRLIRLGSVTHAFDANTMAISLDFTAGDGSLTVTAPANRNVAPPGHYLLFVLNRNGVPSTGRVIRVQ